MQRLRLIIIICVALLGATPAAAQIAVDYQRDGVRYVRTNAEPLYDTFFNSAQYALAATVDSLGQAQWLLEVTYDEGLLDIAAGDTLQVLQRGRKLVTLRTVAPVTRADILRRHYIDRDDYYITARYAMTIADIEALYSTRSLWVHVQAGDYSFDRRIYAWPTRFTRMFNALFTRITE